jgi:HK97 family phage portal protein
MFGWVRKLFNQAVTQPSPPASSRLWFTGRTPAGVYVTPDSALRNAKVWACVQFVTRSVAQLPWHVMIDGASGGSQVLSSHPADWLLWQRPCPDHGSFTWRQSMLGMALLWGNAYAEIERDNRGAAYALWPLHPDRVIVRRDPGIGELEYEVHNYSGGKVVLPADDIFHLRGFGDGPVGYNVVEYAAQSIGWAQATELFGATYFGEGMNPTMLVESIRTLGPDGARKLRQEIEELYKGPRGKRIAILDAGMKATKLATAPNDSQFIETRQHQVEEICRWFGVPPHKVMHLLRATFSNIEHQSIEVVVDCVTPWVKAFEEEANYKLFGRQNRVGLYTKMNLRGLLRGDNASRAQFYKDLWGIGALSANDVLAAEDMNGIGPDGDQRFVPVNYTPLDQARANAKAARTKLTAPPAAPGGDMPAEDMPAETPPAKGNGAASNGAGLPH